MNTRECIMGRRSIRQFKDTPISKELLEEIIEEASYSPSWKNTQITRYIAITGELKDKIASQCTGAHPNNGRIISSAPLLIAVTFVKNRSGFERDGSFSTKKEGGWQMFDAGIASQTLCLAAHEKGLGSVILGIFDEDAAASLLELPEDQELVALIPMGIPDEAPAAPKRKPAADLLSYK